MQLISNEHLTKRHTALKLHKQFAHPSAEKLLRLISHTKLKNDHELKNEIKIISENCKTCKIFKKTPPKPEVALPTSYKFNEIVAMDIKFYHGTPLLHLIDTCTRFSATAVLKSKEAKVVIDNIFKIWISIFGCPQKFISDNGGEFGNQEFRDMAEALNINVTTTAAYSPWSNGLVERYNAVLEDMIDKVREEVDCSINVAVAWAVSAKNSLNNVHGFSPSQLVFGYNPVLPSVYHDKPPALSGNQYSDIIAEHLTAMKKAREAHIQAETSERVRRALNHKTRSYSDYKYLTNDKVYYKKEGDKRWHGPGTIIGQDGQYVLVRDQSTWYRVHPCKLQPANEIELDQSEESETENEENNDADVDVENQDNVIPIPDEPIMQTENHQLKGQKIKKKEPKFKELLKAGAQISFRQAEDTWIDGKVVSRSGKAGGKYGNEWNIDVDGQIHPIDFERNVEEVKLQNKENHVNLCEKI